MKRIPSSHPLCKVRWVWPEAYMYLYNHYAQFRRDFELASAPKKAVFHITADKAYRLYVNGSYVCRGPARGYQSHWPCDEVDLAPFLRKGRNWLSIEGYNPGISTFQYLHQNFAGLLCAFAKGAVADAWDKAEWMMRRDPARSTQTARLSLQIDFQEHIDLSKDDRSWITSETPPSGWRAEIFPDKAHNYMGFPFGMPPFDSVEERGIPLLRESEFIAPLKVCSHGTGRCGDGYRDCKNVDWTFVKECESQGIQWDDGKDVPMKVENGFMELSILPPGDGMFRAITIHAGEYVLGTVSVEVEEAQGDEILDFKHYQYLRDGKPKFVPPGGGCLVAMANRMKLRPGRNSHEFFHPLGFGHFTLIARDVSKPVAVRVRIRKMGYPFTMRGLFECSDPVLNDIHAACRRTQQLCSMDAYVDTPWREQAQWWGDARIQARNTFFLDGDARLLARGIQSIGEQPLLSGLTPGHSPTSGLWCILPDFSLTWILTIWDHYFQTGDISLFKKLLPRVKKVLAYFEGKDVRAPNGLLKYDPRFWLFEDWAPLPKQEVPAFLNLWYCLTLRKVSALLEAAGKSGEAAKIKAKGAQMESLIAEKLFDSSIGLLRPALDANMYDDPRFWLFERMAGEPSVHDQTMALMLGILPEHHGNMIDKVLLPYLKDGEVKGAKASAFWAAYVLEEMMERGYGELCLEFIRKKWAPMLSTGTTWEGFDWDEPSGSSACHAWTSHPSYLFVNILAGIRQLKPGWSEILVKPCFPKSMNYVRAIIPSPKGDVSLEWRRDGGAISGTLTLPEGVHARVESGDAKIAVVNG